MEHLKKISWRTGDPLSKAKYMHDLNDDYTAWTKIPTKVMNAKLPIKPGDRIAIWHEYLGNYKYKAIPAAAEPIRGKTVGALLRAYERGTHKKLPKPLCVNPKNCYFDPR